MNDFRETRVARNTPAPLHIAIEALGSDLGPQDHAIMERIAAGDAVRKDFRFRRRDSIPRKYERRRREPDCSQRGCELSARVAVHFCSRARWTSQPILAQVHCRM